jgi:hypothetical protein
MSPFFLLHEKKKECWMGGLHEALERTSHETAHVLRCGSVLPQVQVHGRGLAACLVERSS